jgi:putative ATP-binding cassette transporter
MYTTASRYYKLPLYSDVDNADQRISEDIRLFTDKAVALFCTVAVSICDLIVFSIVLYRIYPPLYFTLFAYSLVGTLLTIKIGQPLIALNKMQLRKEADLRYDLVRARENAESIAFFNGERREREEATKRFETVYTNARRLLDFERNLGFFTRWCARIDMCMFFSV